MALIAVGLGRLLGDLGFGVAIIQHPHVTQKHKRAAITGSVTMGLFLYSVCWLLEPLISRIFEFEGLTPILNYRSIVHFLRFERNSHLFFFIVNFDFEH